MAKILIVDDDEDFLRLLSEYLESVGFEHDVAANGQQARACLERVRYDVVISDYNMPGETGLDLFRHVSSACPGSRFAIMTGHDLKIKRESMNMGVGAFLQKPFYLSELRQTIIALMQPEAPKEAAGINRAELSLGSTLKIAFCGDAGEFVILRKELGELGYGDAIWACRFNGKALAETLSSRDGDVPDVILLDILMLFQGGLENLEKIKDDGDLLNLPLLLMTGAPEYAEAVFQKYPHLQIDGILTKPVTSKGLTNLLKSYRKNL